MKTRYLYFTDDSDIVHLVFPEVEELKYTKCNEDSSFDYIIIYREGEVKLGGCKLHPLLFSSDIIRDEKHKFDDNEIALKLPLDLIIKEENVQGSINSEVEKELLEMKQKNEQLEKSILEISKLLNIVK